MTMTLLIFLLHIRVTMSAGASPEVVRGLDLSNLTSWFVMNPPTNITPAPHAALKSHSRSLFSDDETDNFQDHKMGDSPSLMLESSDRDDRSYLAHKTLKDSFTDMTRLSQSRPFLDDVKEMCGAMKKGNRIEFSYCPGEITVVSIAGTMKMTCSEVERRLFTGPIVLLAARCTQALVFERNCVEKLSAGYDSRVCNEETMLMALIIQSVLGAVVLFVLVTAIITIVKLHKGLMTSEGASPLQKSGCHFYAEYDEWVNGDGKKCTRPKGEDSVVNMQRKRYSISLCKVMLCALLCRPLSVTSYEVIGSFDSTLMKYSYIVDLLDQESINIGPVTISRSPVFHSGQLTTMFQTANWTIHHKEEYFCQWYKCEAYSVCGMTALPFIKSGSLANQLFQYKNSNNGYYTCQKLYAYCTFGNGCKLLSIEIMPDQENLYTVYSISKGGSLGGEVVVPPGCVLENKVDDSIGNLGDYYLVSDDKRNHFLCPREVFSMRPEGGMLGDLQIGMNNSLNFMVDEIICTADYSERALCRYPPPFVGNLKNLCHTPEKLGLKMDIIPKSNYISWLMSGKVRITMRCDRELPLKSSDHMCQDVQIGVWEVAHLDAPLLITFTGESKRQSSNFKFPSSVHMGTHSFRCDEKTYFSELYDLKSLNSSGLSYDHTVIPYSEINNLQEDHFSDSDPDDGRFSSIVSTITKWSPTITTSTFILISVAVLCMLYCRR